MKKTFIIMSISILLLMTMIPMVYALGNKEEIQFFDVNKNEISPSEVLEMNINLEKIDFNKTKFTLISNFAISEVYNEEENVEIEKENQDINIEIDKEKLNLDKITLYYKIPEETKIGTILKLKAVILNEEETNIEEETKEIEIEVKVVEPSSEVQNPETENKEETKNPEKEQQDELQQNNNETRKESTVKNMESTNVSKISGTNTIKSNASSSGEQIKEETVSYNGSSNNYLSSITIYGYELNKEFNKESSTYFITVNSGVEKLDVTAISEDEDAQVCISGADNLKSNENNKILISVTAKNGTVRTYRIYVTVNS